MWYEVLNTGSSSLRKLKIAIASEDHKLSLQLIYLKFEEWHLFTLLLWLIFCNVAGMYFSLILAVSCIVMMLCYMVEDLCKGPEINMDICSEN